MDEARVAYEAVHREWLAERRLAALHKTTAERLEAELAKLADQETARSGRSASTLDPDSVFGPKAKE